MNEESGGPAFPVNYESKTGYPPLETTYAQHWQGMTLRDYFAAKAMQSFIESGRAVGIGGEEFDRIISHWSYETADAMLKARESK